MDKKISVIIVDDEPSARSVLTGLLNNLFPNIEIVDSCSNIVEAVNSIKNHQPDAVFLDIEMPEYAGYEIVSFFTEINFEIVFVTAYDSYALKAFELSAVDYLLKPIDIARLKNTVSRLYEKVKYKTQIDNYKILVESLQSEKVSKMVISHHGARKVLPFNEIIAIEAQEAYSCIHTTSGDKYLVSRNLKYYENILGSNNRFIRTHKSWIINMDFISSYSKTKMEINLQNNIDAKLSKYKIVEFETSFK